MMKTDLCGVELKNPVIMASGTFGIEYAAFYDLGILGGICSKGLTLEPRQGNAGIRVHETASGMMNSVGLQNPGARYFIEHKLPELLALGTAVIANVGGSTAEEMAEAVSLLNATGVHIIELNISCPNVRHGGVAFGVKAGVAGDAVRRVRAVCRKPLMVKLSPSAENIGEMAAACAGAGADALSLVNTFPAMAVDTERRRPVFSSVTAGLSGPAIKPIALRMVYEACRAADIPVVGLGGITTAADAIEFIMAGGGAGQIGPANFADPLTRPPGIDGRREVMGKDGG
ncbi:MAG: dihydroorotate dehydrogenase, partial [Oscillospiraceae bacterium]|nr:dihydroorotate dehydrogenase [Oscillospiraceae bacterium]